MRPITALVVHCSATPGGRAVTMADIDAWHRAKGWDGIGYHFVIDEAGVCETGRAIEKPGAHVEGHNATTIGICLIGGTDSNQKPKATFTEAQLGGLEELIDQLRERFPGVDVCGHRDFPDVHKACPSFDVRHWRASGEVLP